MENTRTVSMEAHLIAMSMIGLVSTFILTFTIVYLDILKDKNNTVVGAQYHIIESL